jgi:hypothetical protein
MQRMSLVLRTASRDLRIVTVGYLQPGDAAASPLVPNAPAPLSVPKQLKPSSSLASSSAPAAAPVSAASRNLVQVSASACDSASAQLFCN